MVQADTSNNCKQHAVTMLKIERLEQETKQMRIDIDKIKMGTISTPVLVSIIGLTGTFLTVVGGLAGVAMNLFAKSMGWI